MGAVRDRRLPDRKPVMKPATIVDEHDHLTDCYIVDLSRTGAKLRLKAANGSYPQRFQLRFGRELFEAEIVWRDRLDAGVCFVAEGRIPPAAVSAPAAARTSPKALTIAELRKLAPGR